MPVHLLEVEQGSPHAVAQEPVQQAMILNGRDEQNEKQLNGLLLLLLLWESLINEESDSCYPYYGIIPVHGEIKGDIGL